MPITPKNRRAADSLKAAYDDGFLAGRAEAHKELLSMLEKEYMNPKINRDSPEAQAVLIIARRAGEELRKLRTNDQ